MGGLGGVAVGVPLTGQVTVDPAGTRLFWLQLIAGVGGAMVHCPAVTPGGRSATLHVAFVAAVEPWLVQENDASPTEPPPGGSLEVSGTMSATKLERTIGPSIVFAPVPLTG